MRSRRWYILFISLYGCTLLLSRVPPALMGLHMAETQTAGVCPCCACRKWNADRPLRPPPNPPRQWLIHEAEYIFSDDWCVPCAACWIVKVRRYICTCMHRQWAASSCSIKIGSIDLSAIGGGIINRYFYIVDPLWNADTGSQKNLICAHLFVS